MDQILKTLDDLTDCLNDKDMHNVRIGFTLAVSLFRISTALDDEDGREDAELLVKQVLSGKVVDTKENMKHYQRLLVETCVDVLEQEDIKQLHLGK